MKNKGEGGQMWKGYVFFTIGSLIAVAEKGLETFLLSVANFH